MLLRVNILRGLHVIARRSRSNFEPRWHRGTEGHRANGHKVAKTNDEAILNHGDTEVTEGHRANCRKVAKTNDEAILNHGGTEVTEGHRANGRKVAKTLISLRSFITSLRGAAHPARYLGENGIKGSIKTGKQADLLLLNANPLEDIRNTRKISGLFIKGIYYDQPALEDLKTK